MGNGNLFLQNSFFLSIFLSGLKNVAISFFCLCQYRCHLFETWFQRISVHSQIYICNLRLPCQFPIHRHFSHSFLVTQFIEDLLCARHLTDCDWLKVTETVESKTLMGARGTGLLSIKLPIRCFHLTLSQVFQNNTSYHLSPQACLSSNISTLIKRHIAVNPRHNLKITFHLPFPLMFHIWR